MAFDSSILMTKVTLINTLTPLMKITGSTLRKDTAGAMITNERHTNVTSAIYPKGALFEYDDGGDPVQFIFLQLGSVSGTHAIVAGSMCGLEIDGAGVLTGKVSNHATTGLAGGPALIAVAPCTVGNWSLWQCAGKAAVTLVPALGTAASLDTDGSVIQGALALVAEDSALALGVAAAGEVIVGVSGSADV